WPRFGDFNWQPIRIAHADGADFDGRNRLAQRIGDAPGDDAAFDQAERDVLAQVVVTLRLWLRRRNIAAPACVKAIRARRQLLEDKVALVIGRRVARQPRVDPDGEDAHDGAAQRLAIFAQHAPGDLPVAIGRLRKYAAG